MTETPLHQMLNKPTLLASQRLAMFLAQTLALALVQQHSTLEFLRNLFKSNAACVGLMHACLSSQTTHCRVGGPARSSRRETPPRASLGVNFLMSGAARICVPLADFRSRFRMRRGSGTAEHLRTAPDI